MKKKTKIALISASVLMLAFILFTVLLTVIDVRPIGPNDSRVGFAALNNAVFQGIGTHLLWYTITDWLGLAGILVAFIFALIGLIQLIKRRSLKKVDVNLLILGGFYIVLIALYVLFEKVIINYRPVLINGYLEASYPSSHTLITLFLLGSGIMEFNELISNKPLKIVVGVVSVAIIAITVIGRLISGVHWFSDIIGGLLLSWSLLTYYYALRKGV